MRRGSGNARLGYFLRNIIKMLTDFILLFLLLLLYGKANYSKAIKYKLKVQLKFLTISLAYMPSLPVAGMAGIHQFALPEASLYYT